MTGFPRNVEKLWKKSAKRLGQRLQAGGMKVFHFDGGASFSRRLAICDEAKRQDRSVLVTTQQSLKSSVNIPWISFVIAETQPWNFSQMYQWALRFCRLNSPRAVDIKVLCAAGSIDELILALLLKKEGIAKVAAGDVYDGEETLFDEFGINGEDLLLLAETLSKRDDEDLLSVSNVSGLVARQIAA